MKEKHKIEEWRAVPGHDGYEVSSHGRIRSVERVITLSNGKLRRRSGVVLKAHAVPNAPRYSDRYAHVMLGRGRMRRIHQVVAWAFIGSQPIGLYACHDDGDITNNWAYNIYYGTAVQNQLDRRRHGRLGIGESHHAAYLTVKDVLEIRERLAANEKQSEIAVAFGVTASCISEIKTRARWDHV